MKKRNMTKKAFVAWLKQQSSRRFLPHSATACPLGRFTGCELSWSGADLLARPANGREFLLPRWAGEFGYAVLKFGPKPISGARILREMKL